MQMRKRESGLLKDLFLPDQHVSDNYRIEGIVSKVIRVVKGKFETRVVQQICLREGIAIEWSVVGDFLLMATRLTEFGLLNCGGPLCVPWLRTAL